MNDLESVLRNVIREEVRSALEEMLPHFQKQHVTRPVEPEQALLLSTRDAAKHLTISERTLFKLTQSGQLPCVRLGTSKRYSVETIKHWIQKTEAASAPHSHSPPRKSASSPEIPKQPPSKSVKRADPKRTSQKKPKSHSNAGSQAIQKSTAQRTRDAEDQKQPPNPFSLLLAEIGVERADMPTITNGDLMRIAEVDISTYHGWRYLGHSISEEAIENLREYFRRFRKSE